MSSRSSPLKAIPLRRRPSGGVAPERDADGVLLQYLAASKRSVVADPSDQASLDRVRALLSDADVVVWSRGSSVSEVFTRQELRELAPRAVVTTITPFGLEGPWADRPATEAVLQAMGGSPMTRGNPARPPVAGRPSGRLLRRAQRRGRHPHRAVAHPRIRAR